jgi:very-short-patch-repair endonuclease
MKKRTIIPYNPKLKLLARKLRTNSTKSEVLMWNYLKGKQVLGYDFHRQKPILDFIVDFYCSELNLAIEIDGESHYGNEIKDEIRQKEIEKYGVSFLRFDESQIYFNLDGVIKIIDNWIQLHQNKHTP